VDEINEPRAVERGAEAGDIHLCEYMIHADATPPAWRRRNVGGTRYGRPMDLAQRSADEVQSLEVHHEDEYDIELCEAIKARNEPGVPHDVFMSSFDAA
jgi:hypothetical protein